MHTVTDSLAIVVRSVFTFVEVFYLQIPVVALCARNGIAVFDSRWLASATSLAIARAGRHNTVHFIWTWSLPARSLEERLIGVQL